MPLFCIGRSWFQLLSDNFLRAHGLEPRRERKRIGQKREREIDAAYICEVHQNAIEISQSVMLFAAYPCAGNRGWESERANELKERDGCTSSRISSACVCALRSKTGFLIASFLAHGIDANRMHFECVSGDRCKPTSVSLYLRDAHRMLQ
jgi:hypothetical protein